MRSRSPGRVLVIALALLNMVRRSFGRSKPASPRRILVVHHLSLGDTIMVTPLLKKLREQYPSAEIVMTCPLAFLELYAGRPYGVIALPFDEKEPRTIFGLLRRRGFDLAIIPAENRLSWLARALNSRWIVAFSGDSPAYKNWPIDELRPFPEIEMAWGDLAASLIDGQPPEPFCAEEWPAPVCELFELPSKPYCVMHVGARTPLRLWEPNKWHELTDDLGGRGLNVVWSAGRKEANLIDQVDWERRFARYPGNLSLAQLWHLLSQAELLVSLDTGIAHLGRIAAVPSVVLFGPGSPILCSGGEFWRNIRGGKAFIPEFPCRNRNIVFRRYVPWAGHCNRTLRQCAIPLCMQQLSVDRVKQEVSSVLARSMRVTATPEST